MSDNILYKSDKITIYEWKNPIFEICYTNQYNGLLIKDKKDIIGIINTLSKSIVEIKDQN